MFGQRAARGRPVSRGRKKEPGGAGKYGAAYGSASPGRHLFFFSFFFKNLVGKFGRPPGYTHSNQWVAMALAEIVGRFTTARRSISVRRRKRKHKPFLVLVSDQDAGDVNNVISGKVVLYGPDKKAFFFLFLLVDKTEIEDVAVWRNRWAPLYFVAGTVCQSRKDR